MRRRRQISLGPDRERICDVCRTVVFTDRIGGSLAVMRTSFVLGIEAPLERDDYKGAGKALSWED